MAWKINWTTDAQKDASKISRPILERIRRCLDDVRASGDPRSKGKALAGPLAGLWRYRVSDYRVICIIKDDVLIVTAIAIGHRSSIYRRISRRLHV